MAQQAAMDLQAEQDEREAYEAAERLMRECNMHKDLAQHLYQQGYKTQDIEAAVKSGRAKLMDVANEIGWKGEVYRVKPAESKIQAPVAPRPQVKPMVQQPVAMPAGTSGMYYGFRGFLADGLATFLAAALWVVSANYTKAGIAVGLEWLGFLSASAWMLGTGGYLVCMALSALQREYAPWFLRPSYYDEEPERVEIVYWLLTVAFGVTMTVLGVAGDLTAREIAIPLAGWVGLVVAGILLEIAPEPLLQFFGGRLLMRIPIVRDLLIWAGELSDRLRNVRQIVSTWAKGRVQAMRQQKAGGGRLSRGGRR